MNENGGVASSVSPHNQLRQQVPGTEPSNYAAGEMPASEYSLPGMAIDEGH
jgi:hypothetical protein